MSIKLMTQAWECDLATGPKMVLLSMCDQANDQGVGRPSVNTVMRRCSMGRATLCGPLAALATTRAARRRNLGVVRGQ